MRGIGIIVTLVIAAIVGVGAYQIGVAQGIATTGTAVAPAVYYHPFFYGGFGFLGFLFPLLFIFLIFGLLRGAFWGGWGRGYGRGGYWGDRASRLEEWHMREHVESAGKSGSGSTTPPSGR